MLYTETEIDNFAKRFFKESKPRRITTLENSTLTSIPQLTDIMLYLCGGRNGVSKLVGKIPAPVFFFNPNHQLGR
jgi:hypothetical protein